MSTEDQYKLLLKHPDTLQQVVESLSETLEREVTCVGLDTEIQKVVEQIREDYRAARAAGLDCRPLFSYHMDKDRQHLMLLAIAIARERGKRWGRK